MKRLNEEDAEIELTQVDSFVAVLQDNMADAFRIKLPTEERRAQRPHARPFDEISIVTLPRYKTSGLSGDEWRISTCIQIKRKGRVIHECNCGNGGLERALLFVGSEYQKALDDGKGCYVGEGDWCDQESCRERPL